MQIFRKHHIIAIIMSVMCAFGLSAEQTTTVQPPLLPVDNENTEMAGLPGSEDEYMPSLSELLGEPVDDLGDPFVSEMIAGEMIDYAKQFLGTRYRRGAKGPSAFDCSGFTSYIFKKFGITLSAASRTQSTEGESINLAEARPGDLMFFSGSRAGKNVGHVAMIVDVDSDTGVISFIHASVSKGIAIDHYPDGGYYSRRFISVRRVLTDEAAATMALL